MSGATLDNLSTESRSFPPPDGFAEQPNATAEWYERADADREAFWAEQAGRLAWAQPFGTRCWTGSRLREVVRRREAQRRVQLRRPPRRGRPRRAGRVPLGGRARRHRTITYADLQREVSKAANALTELGVGAGDRVAIQLPMIPEAVVSMLACARLGAAHSVVFGGFSPGALKARVRTPRRSC